MKNPHKQTNIIQAKNRNQQCGEDAHRETDTRGVSQCHIVTLPHVNLLSILASELLRRIAGIGNEKDPDESGPKSHGENRAENYNADKSISVPSSSRFFLIC